MRERKRDFFDTKRETNTANRRQLRASLPETARYEEGARKCFNAHAQKRDRRTVGRTSHTVITA